jgi:hypothetical protein
MPIAAIAATALGASATTAAVVGGVASLAQGALADDANGDAIDAQREGAAASDATQRYFYDTTRKDNLPFLETGYKANDQLSALLAGGQIGKLPTFADYTRDPSYAWQQGEALKAVQGSAAARGGLYSGATQRAISDRAQGIAASDYGNWWNRQQQGQTNQVNMLNAIRSGGQTAAGQVGAAGQNAANAISGNALALGNAQGASSIASGNIWSNALNRASSYMPRGTTVSGPGSPGNAGAGDYTDPSWFPITY